MSNIRQSLIDLIDSVGEFLGSADLADAIPADRREVRRHLRELDANGQLIYRPTLGGRGNKSVIRKRNRNQPGLPRRVR